MDDSWKNFFTLKRKLLWSDLWLGEKFTKGQAWVDMIGLANHSPGEVTIRGIKIPLKRGQLAVSEVAFAARWKWSRNKVRRFLCEMEAEQRMKQQKTNVSTVITLVNYNAYQLGGTANETADDTAEGHIKDLRDGKEKGKPPVVPPSDDPEPPKTQDDLTAQFKASLGGNNGKPKKPTFKNKADEHDYAVQVTELPPQLNTEEIKALWLDFCAERRGSKKYMTERAAQMQIVLMAKHPIGVVVAGLEKAIASGWQSLNFDNLPRSAIKEPVSKAPEDRWN